MILIKEGVEFKYSPGGIAILDSLKTLSHLIGKDLTITSGSDGVHSGENDPHYSGDAYDVRSHDLDDNVKALVIKQLDNLLGDKKFFFFLEVPGTANEHFHIQVRNEQEFSIEDYLKL